MKTKSYILILISALILTGCSQGIAVFVQLFNLDSNINQLEIGFDFKGFTKDQDVKVRNIKIYENDSLIYELESIAQTVSYWRFPEIPNGFEIRYPKHVDSIRTFKKEDNLRFEFKGFGKYAAYGSWNYKAKYSTKECRWLFDEEGNKKIDIDCYYEPWIGKDIIKVVSNNEFEVDTNSFELRDSSNNLVEFELKVKENMTDRIALALEDDLKTGQILYLTFNAHNGKKYKERIVVPDKLTVGIVGKYNDL
jgi:hypothetical protein